MLLTKKSPYHHFSQHENRQSLSLLQKKTKSIYHADAREANDEKYLEQNMLNKLLRPPAKRQSKGVLRKYDPHFPKPDIEKLIHENTQLKTEISQNTKVIMELRFRVKEQQKKISKLESNDEIQLQEILEKKKKNPSAYIQILKKKIHELHTKFISAEAQIKKLKKLPGASIYEQNNIQKQHLLAETIRLKSILTSYESQNIELDPEMTDQKQKCQQNAGNTLNNGKFQQQFLRMLKQQNQKLKATIRLLQNDKILMKARQTTQNKQSNDLKKQLDHLKNKLILREAEIQKLTHENQNLLFKKAAKFKLQKEEKENKLIQELTKSIEELRQEKKKLESQKNELLIDNQELKKKEQAKNIELIEKDKELEKAKFQNAEIKNEYEGRINLLQTNKLYSKESGIRSKSSKGANYTYFNTNAYNFNDLRKMDEDFEIIQKSGGMDEEQMQGNRQKGKFNWGKPIKFEQLDFCLLKIWSLREEGIIENYEDLLFQSSQYQTSKNRKKTSITFEQLYALLKAPPVCLPSKQSIKLSKYIFSDHYSLPAPSNFGNHQTKQHPVIQISLAVTIIKASINQFTECLSNGNVINSWKILLSKSKKFIRELEQFHKQTISKDQFVQVVIKNKTNTLLFQEINYMLLHGFNPKISVNEIYLNRRKMLECMYGLMGDPQYLTSMFIRTNIANFIPSSNSNSSSNQISIMKYCHGKQNAMDKQQKRKQNKQVKGEYCNLVNLKPMLTNSYYEPEQKSGKEGNTEKAFKTHHPHSILNQRQQNKMSKELKLLNLQKVNSQTDEDKVNLEDRGKSTKFKSCHGDNVSLASKDKQPSNLSANEDQESKEVEADLMFLENQWKENSELISHKEEEQNKPDQEYNECQQGQQQAEGSQFQQNSSGVQRVSNLESSLQLTDEENVQDY